MSALSTIGIITKSLELAKARKVGVQFTYFDVIELLGHIKALEEDSVLATHELAAYQLRIREFEQVSKKLEELEARWKIAETDVMDIVGSALSGDCEKYQYFDRNGNRYVRWGIVGNDLRAIFYNHTDIVGQMSVVVKTSTDNNKLKELSDRFYLLLVDNPETKLLADQIMIDVYGKCEPSPSDVSVTQDVLMDIKKDLSDAEIEELGAQQAESKNICPSCDGAGELAGDYFSDDGMFSCGQCQGRGTI